MKHTGTSVLSVDQVSKSFRGLKALSSITLEVRRGEILGLIGPNGSGKTTLFNVISGFQTPDAGTITFDGTMLNGLKPHEICKLGLARTFQIVRPFSHLSVLQNVAVGCVGYTGDLVQTEAKCWEILSFMGMEKKAMKEAGGLTIPDRKRLEIARALSVNPRVMLLDETMAGLNPTDQNELVLIVRRIRETGITVVVIEHAMRVVMGLCSRIVVLHHGEILAEGQPATVCSDEKVIDAYLGRGYRVAAPDKH
jgi:branched-chain amino acid transport system ATP-binding protein